MIFRIRSDYCCQPPGLERKKIRWLIVRTWF